jgi:hypothetical protein
MSLLGVRDLGRSSLLLLVLTSACDPSFDPIWHAAGWQQPGDPLDAGSSSAPIDPVDGGQDAAVAPDAATMPALDAGVVGSFLTLICRLEGCIDAGPDCTPLCSVACADVQCEPGEPCSAAGRCLVVCATCGTVIK